VLLPRPDPARQAEPFGVSRERRERKGPQRAWSYPEGWCHTTARWWKARGSIARVRTRNCSV